MSAPCKCRPVCAETKPGRRCRCGCHDAPDPVGRPYTVKSAADEIMGWMRRGGGIDGTVRGIIADVVADSRPAPMTRLEAHSLLMAWREAEELYNETWKPIHRIAADAARERVLDAICQEEQTAPGVVGNEGRVGE